MKYKTKNIKISCDGGAATGKSTGAKMIAKKYKLEFSRNYDRYRELHCKIEKVSKRFANLEMQLRGEPEGSESYKV